MVCRPETQASAAVQGPVRPSGSRPCGLRSQGGGPAPTAFLVGVVAPWSREAVGVGHRVVSAGVADVRGDVGGSSPARNGPCGGESVRPRRSPAGSGPGSGSGDVSWCAATTRCASAVSRVADRSDPGLHPGAWLCGRCHRGESGVARGGSSCGGGGVEAELVWKRRGSGAGAPPGRPGPRFVRPSDVGAPAKRSGAVSTVSSAAGAARGGVDGDTEQLAEVAGNAAGGADFVKDAALAERLERDTGGASGADGVDGERASRPST